MSHAVIYEDFSCGLTLKQVENEVLNYVRSHGDGYGTTSLSMLTTSVFNTREDAEEYIEREDKGDYYGIIVKYLDLEGIEDEQKIKSLNDKLYEARNELEAYIEKHSFKNKKTAYIKCPSCGSKLNKEKLTKESCPLCNSDLRSASVIKRISSLNKKLAKNCDKYNRELEKLKKKKTNLKWLVKFEYHC